MGKGFIKVQLFSGKNMMPVIGGSIFIMESNDIEFENGKILTTDQWGISETITVNTPEKIVSENPIAIEVPYSSYDIYVRAKGYRDVAVEGVQVFCDNLSIQNIEMIPTKKEGIFMEEAEFIFITSHQLLDKNPRDKREGVKPTGGDKTLITMPENITVHIGAPSSYGENVTLNFLDYIKNVVASEIYPTWPEEAIKTNIYATISFALNRIRSRWYRENGYAFDITNCITYDQAFIKGRNIYENISKIVDEIFNEYVGDKESKEPIFAQCCSGTTSTCNGLSQWGSVSLANSGALAIDILKNFFGEEIDIGKIYEIEGGTELYPGTEFKIGSKDIKIEELQKSLKGIAYNYPLMNKSQNISGDFDEITENAVKDFQLVFNIEPTGIINKITWYKILLINKNLNTLMEFKEEADKDYNKGICPEYLLRYGDSGAAVREFQCYLGLISLYYSVIPTIKVNGEFDLNTKAAVLAFQKKFNNVDVDGIVGKQTWNKIYEVYCDLK